jgi:hypothetical protein
MAVVAINENLSGPMPMTRSISVRIRGCRSEWKLTSHTEICTVTGMKTTLDLNDAVLAKAKALAAKQRTSLTRLIEEGLELRLRSSPIAAKARRRRIPVFKGRGGLVAGVNPVSNRSMLDAADDDT